MSFNTATRTFDGIATVDMTCWCSLQFVIPRSLFDYYQRRNEDDRGSFSLCCPLGHSMVPAGPTRTAEEAKRLRETNAFLVSQLDQKSEAVAQRDRQLAARKGQLTKLRKRIANGVCPVCNRSFAGLHRHMQTEHPEWHQPSDD